ncbi:MAG: DUF262 domain-containing protein [Bacteroidetes bacterium]|nr:DUF262 domain-containing protein [Bacteroidota bacterium]
MEENILVLKTIGEIIKEMKRDDFMFFVDSYQRGYKWDRLQVVDLLNDINDFRPIGDEFYCLQPIVVKRVENNRIELIDGQQRMTTIFIILSYLEKEKYEIDYRTREKSADFLSNNVATNLIKDQDWGKFKDLHRDINNIDNYHFFIAYNSIKDWFLKNTVDKDTFWKKLIQNTKVIWYEIIETRVIKPQEVFARINMGKIPLTNSELIKALFLSNKDINDSKKNEIALEWDSIEYALQNDEFWYFMSDSNSYSMTRIDLLFDLLSEKDREDKKADHLFSFRHYYENKGKKTINQYWQEITERYYLLQDWFNDRELYHLIGYLVATSGKNKLKELTKKYYKSTSTSLFKKTILSEIHIFNEIFEEIKYGSDMALKVLLLFNIKTTIQTQSDDRYFVRFPFQKFKTTQWSIEHIHAQNSKGLNTKEQWKAWLNEAKKGLELIQDKYGVKEVIQKINAENNDSLKNEVFQSLFNEIIKVSGDNKDDSEMHDLSNLALLDGGTNSALSNNIFIVKRGLIIQKEITGEFIPICTRNVFLKYYSENPSQLFFWSEQDRNEYIKEMKTMLEITKPNIN